MWFRPLNVHEVAGLGGRGRVMCGVAAHSCRSSGAATRPRPPCVHREAPRHPKLSGPDPAQRYGLPDVRARTATRGPRLPCGGAGFDTGGADDVIPACRRVRWPGARSPPLRRRRRGLGVSARLSGRDSWAPPTSPFTRCRYVRSSEVLASWIRLRSAATLAASSSAALRARDETLTRVRPRSSRDALSESMASRSSAAAVSMYWLRNVRSAPSLCANCSTTEVVPPCTYAVTV